LSDHRARGHDSNILEGQFIVRGTALDGKPHLELNFRGKFLRGEQEGLRSVYEPIRGRATNVTSAELFVSADGTSMTGKVSFVSGNVTIERSLDLVRAE
jgi:hypothetical protein